ncbi:MAG: hypothetical protein GWN00_22065 [Aliifodinibius sp.]|nr:hypothetical protein [Phycisphaerae bacterium]NIT58807.1 hypothetical protein [Fodinibius sp.]NIV13652.1 hypothetical protein [Fodinibius sp.]NIY27390.1 hypothetical protein [Fodinibius sp.]
MGKILKSKLVMCFLILVLASTIIVFAGDVTVKDGDLTVDGYLYVKYNATIYTYLATEYLSVNWQINCYKLNATVIDPAGVLYDLQTRQEVIECIKRTIAPDKQGGALVFFNKDTRRLETYIPSEGKFYDLQGKLIYTMPAIDVATNSKTLYYLDIMTGEVKAKQEVVVDRYKVKRGFRLDRETGHFINMVSGEIVPKETAIDLIKGL